MLLEKFTIPFSVLVLAGLITYGAMFKPSQSTEAISFFTGISSQNGVLVLPWGDLGQKLAASGAIDAAKIEALYQNRGGLNPEEKDMLYGNPETVNVTKENAGFVLNMLWAAGLANKNMILEKGEMMDSRYNGAGNFASTGGWSLSRGDAMGHYSMHQIMSLSAAQQNLVDEVTKNIYRPCCGNSTHFPDCNHGMAMLGAMELLASKGADEKQLYEAAYALNSMWFPQEYANIRNYFVQEKLPTNPKEMVSLNYASSWGYQQVLSKVQPVPAQGNGGCGV